MLYARGKLKTPLVIDTDGADGLKVPSPNQNIRHPEFFRLLCFARQPKKLGMSYYNLSSLTSQGHLYSSPSLDRLQISIKALSHFDLPGTSDAHDICPGCLQHASN
jgi:hypothetical protein